jgi:polar amino acid transport system permease protein
MAMTTAKGGRGVDETEAPPPLRTAFQWRPGRLIVSVLAFGLMAGVVYALVASPNIEWSAFWHYLFNPAVLSGVRLTLILTAVSMVFGILLGALAAFGKMSTILGLRAISNAYIWLFRGTPVLVQLIITFNLSLFIPRIVVGSWRIDTNTLTTPVMAALIALSLNEGAYMAEFIRGGILSVGEGQMEAAIAQGMRRGRAMRRVILPQALPAIIPAVGNQTISMLKSTSIVSVIAAAELLTQVQIIYSANYLIMELLFVACFWYLLIVSVATVGQHWIEARVSRSRASVGLGKRIRGNVMPRLRAR